MKKKTKAQVGPFILGKTIIVEQYQTSISTFPKKKYFNGNENIFTLLNNHQGIVRLNLSLKKMHTYLKGDSLFRGFKQFET